MSRGHSLIRSRGTPHAPDKKSIGNKWNSRFINRGVDYASNTVPFSYKDLTEIWKDIKPMLETPSVKKPTKVNVKDLSVDQVLYYTCKTIGYSVVAESIDKGRIFKSDMNGKGLKHGLDNGLGRHVSELPRNYLRIEKLNEVVDFYGLSFSRTETGTWLVEILNEKMEWVSLEGTDLMDTMLRVNLAYSYGMELDNV